MMVTIMGVELLQTETVSSSESAPRSMVVNSIFVTAKAEGPMRDVITVECWNLRIYIFVLKIDKTNESNY